MVDPTKLSARTLFEELDARSRALFRQIVESYLESGEPVGSRTLAKATPLALSAATIRNVMADLEQMGLLYAPHTSAGRLPTQLGLRLFIDGLLEMGTLSAPERAVIEERLAGSGENLEDLLTLATTMLSGLSGCAGLVVAPKLDEAALKHVEFVSVGPGKGLAILVTEGGAVENRVIELPLGMPPSALTEASNFLNARLRGRTLDEAREDILAEIERERAELDRLTAKVIAAGLATWSGAEKAGARTPQLIVRGQAHLLENLTAAEDLERIRMLFDDLEGKKDMIQLLDLAKEADGVRIFIGSENKLFSLSGSSLIVAPYKSARSKVIGVLGVIGPTRLNYARVIPMVDYTAQVIGRLIK